jgi:Flp pilus assembly protein TadG
MTGMRMRDFLRAEKGQSLVEVALTIPLLLLLLTGGAEFASLGYAVIEVSSAAKAAVQYGGQEIAYATNSSANVSSMQNVVNDEVMLVPGLASVTVSNASTTLACSDGTVPTDGSTSGPYSPSDCSSSRAVETLAVTTTATFHSWAIINPLLKACNLPTSFNLTGRATQVVL